MIAAVAPALVGAAVWTALWLLLLRRRLAYLVLLTFVLFGQNLVTMALLRFGNLSPEQGRLLLYAKEAAIATGLGVVLVYVLARILRTRRLRLDAAELLVLGYLFYLLVPFVTSQAPSIQLRLAGLRFLGLLPLLYLMGRWLRYPVSRLPQLLGWYVFVASALALFGLIEAFLLPDDFWLRIGHEEYYLMKQGRPIQGTLFGNMRFWLPDVEQPLRRVASLTGDPLVSSYPMTFVLTLLASYAVIYRRLPIPYLGLALVVGSAIALTLSRGALLTFTIAAALLVAAGSRTLRFRWFTALGYVATVVLAVGFSEAILQVASGEGHVRQLEAGLLIGFRHPFGIGLGTTGGLATNVAAAAGLEAGVQAGGDSFLGSTAIQAGLVGVVFMFTAMLAICVGLVRDARRLRAHRSPLVWIYLGTATYLAGLFVTSTVTESGYGLIANGMSFLFAGILASCTPALVARTGTRDPATEPRTLRLQLPDPEAHRRA